MAMSALSARLAASTWSLRIVRSAPTCAAIASGRCGVAGDHLGRAGQARGDHAHAADRAAAGDQHRLADQIAGTVHRVQADRQRLGAGQLAERDVFVHRRELRLAEHELLAEQALRMRNTLALPRKNIFLHRLKRPPRQ
jgi:hypothetical protein